MRNSLSVEQKGEHSLCQDVKPTLHPLEHKHKRYTKSPPTCFGTLFFHRQGVLTEVEVSVFKMAHFIHQSHILAHV